MMGYDEKDMKGGENTDNDMCVPVFKLGVQLTIHAALSL